MAVSDRIEQLTFRLPRFSRAFEEPTSAQTGKRAFRKYIIEQQSG